MGLIKPLIAILAFLLPAAESGVIDS